jgi:type IV secretory pathway TraG/TraD family ATPase VirD4
VWTFLSNALSSPKRALATLAVVLVLLIALVCSPATMYSLAIILGLFALPCMFRETRRFVLPLCCGAFLIAGGISLVSEIAALGLLPLAAAGIVVAGTVAVWTRTFRAAPASRGARWATLRDLRRGGFLQEHGWPLGSVEGHTVRLPMEREREGILVTAATGSGKTSCLVIPALEEEARRPDPRSLVILDPKAAELSRISMSMLARTHRVLLFDPSDPDACTVGLDPLATLPAPSDDRFVGETTALAGAWFWATRHGTHSSDPFWVTMPLALMESLFIAFVVIHPNGTFVELADWIRRLNITTFQDVLDHTPSPAIRDTAEVLRSLGMSERTIGPIWSDVLQRFEILSDPRVRKSMSGRPIDRTFVTQPTALYLRVGAQDAERFGPLLSMALGQLYRELTRIAAQSPGHRLEREVRVIVDEFGTLPRIYGLENALSTLRSYGVGHYMFAQMTAQLVASYGRELAETIEGNLVTRIVLGGAEQHDAKKFSDRCGEITEYRPHRSWSGQGLLGRSSRSLSYAPEKRPLIAPAEIIHMRDTVLVSTRGMSPIRAVAEPYFSKRRSS